jgi:hypothetical protein
MLNGSSLSRYVNCILDAIYLQDISNLERGRFRSINDHAKPRAVGLEATFFENAATLLAHVGPAQVK